MENASKALLIAAGVLIGIMILSTIVVFKSVFGNFSQEYYQKLNTQKIQEFNSNFTKYENREDLTAQDIVTITNFAKEWNTTVDDNNAIKINGRNPNDVKLNGWEILSNEFLENCSTYKDTTSGKIQNYKYRINKIEYSDEGRVNNVLVNN